MNKSEVVMNSIVKKIQYFENEFIHLKIFNILTDNGKLQNFSHNSNGVFFDLGIIEFDKLQEIDKKLSYYRTTSDNVKENNKNREKLVDTMKKTVSYLPKNKDDESCESDDNKDEENVTVKAYNDDDVSDCSMLSDSELFGNSSDIDQ